VCLVVATVGITRFCDTNLCPVLLVLFILVPSLTRLPLVPNNTVKMTGRSRPAAFAAVPQLSVCFYSWPQAAGLTVPTGQPAGFYDLKLK
jgi:hypothetical protein